MDIAQYLCFACNAHDIEMSHCARCGIARYCSKKCQVNDWPKHKQDCKKKDGKDQNTDVITSTKYVEDAIIEARKNSNRRIAENMCSNVKKLPISIVYGLQQLSPGRFLHFQYVGKNASPSEKDLVASMIKSLKYLYMIHTDVVILYIDKEEIPSRDADMDVILGDPNNTSIPMPKIKGEYTFVMSSWINKQDNAYQIPIQLIQKKK